MASARVHGSASLVRSAACSASCEARDTHAAVAENDEDEDADDEEEDESEADDDDGPKMAGDADGVGSSAKVSCGSDEDSIRTNESAVSVSSATTMA